LYKTDYFFLDPQLLVPPSFLFFIEFRIAVNVKHKFFPASQLYTHSLPFPAPIPSHSLRQMKLSLGFRGLQQIMYHNAAVISPLAQYGVAGGELKSDVVSLPESR